ncbi:MAG: GNAT family N-acetyltransferase, partial [Planctomycetota bacterium]
REQGMVEFEFDCRSLDLLREAIRWKRQQYRRTNILDLFVPEWTRSLLEELCSNPGCETSEMRGVLSVLKAGGKVVAMHVGLLEKGLLHYWFPSYNPSFARYSPGTGLFREILGSASENDLHCIDMGYGEQPYKLKQTDSLDSVSQGCFTGNIVYRHWRCASNHASSLLRRLPGKEPIKRVYRRLLPNAGITILD